MELNKWPSVFITETLLSSIARVRSGTIEDAARDGFATEDVDMEEFHGDIPSTTSAFPTLFPWGTGKHIDANRQQPMKLQK